MKTRSVRKTILDLIFESKDENIKGKAFREESWLSQIRFSDVVDIILYYMILQQDIERFSRISSTDFYHLFKNVWDEWIIEEENKAFFDLRGSWSNGPGPMGGTAGPAEMYMFYHPGITNYETIYSFFFETYSNWPNYSGHMKIMVLPKWRREKNLKNINLVFNLAHRICEAMRKETN